LASWQKAGDEKLHKIIVSPEHPEKIDLKLFTRSLMAEVESDIGKPVDWTAIIHKNTDNPHVHIALRGVDRDGRSLDIVPYLGHGFRRKCSD
jgi:type IV secretory pathway VirD2 relaxase